PGRLHYLHGERHGGGPTRPSQCARQQPHAGPLHFRHAEDRPHHGERRGRLPSLRTVRGAVPDGRLGYAQVSSRYGTGGTGMSQPIASVTDFVVKFANVNGSGSASANTLFAKTILRMGVPVA